MERGTFVGREYIDALKTHYPHFVVGAAQEKVDDKLHIGIVDDWCRNYDEVGVDTLARYQSIRQRPWGAARGVWESAGGGPNRRMAGAYGSYKGLINLKPATDLVLYSNLIWELRPKTILEFGSLQGGSALWFADQLDALCGGQGEVHSFELCYKCIHPRASHPRLRFHEADMRDLSTLKREFLESLPRPWLVIDDCHENLENVVPFMASLMQEGDYFVIEDAFSNPTPEIIGKATEAIDGLGFLVDTKYTDAYGMNVTCAPNGWLVKI
ncbi:MAG TPA: CmcI family methyltransferase [bacterium]|nr:CmcI family methyltransferase [bacterium]